MPVERGTAPPRAAVPPAGTPAAPCPRALGQLRLLTWLPVGALGALLALSVLAPGAAAAAAVPVAVAGAVVGIPHGAADHLVPWWWSGARRAPRRAPAALTAAYGLVAGAAAAALVLAPAPALAAALVLSAVHFGRGEVVAWAERAGRPVPGPTTDALPAAAAGLAVVGLLLWRDPATTDPWLRLLSPAVADAALASRAAGLVLVAVTVVAAVTALALRHRAGEAAELALISAVFAVAPPLAAFGVWFGLWHAVRHTGRLLDLARAAGGDRTWRAATARLARASAVPTAAALAAVAALWPLRDAVGLEVVVGVLLALTFPHAAVVWALDRRAARPGPARRPAG
ncbi:beta-carotene 15,15'-dioxygenase, Brp/Blh family [Geodermatophilus sp. SYSU D00758]